MYTSVPRTHHSLARNNRKILPSILLPGPSLHLSRPILFPHTRLVSSTGLHSAIVPRLSLLNTGIILSLLNQLFALHISFLSLYFLFLSCLLHRNTKPLHLTFWPSNSHSCLPYLNPTCRLAPVRSDLQSKHRSITNAHPQNNLYPCILSKMWSRNTSRLSPLALQNERLTFCKLLLTIALLYPSAIDIPQLRTIYFHKDNFTKRQERPSCSLRNTPRYLLPQVNHQIVLLRCRKLQTFPRRRKEFHKKAQRSAVSGLVFQRELLLDGRYY